MHDLYVQPPGHREALLPGCAVSRPDKLLVWKQRRANEALQAVSLLESGAASALDSDAGNDVEYEAETQATNGRTQAAQFVRAEALLTLGRQQEAAEAWQACAESDQQQPLPSIGSRVLLEMVFQSNGSAGPGQSCQCCCTASRGAHSTQP